MSSPSRFQRGDLAVLRAEPETVVPITRVILGGDEVRYVTFRDDHEVTYYESQLQPAPRPERPRLNADELRALLTSQQLRSPSSTHLQALRSGRIEFVPYQYRPVLRLIRTDRPRLLIADEVGVGKTIEAGLILKELQARMDVSSVLIICPPALVAGRKWQIEMKRFDEHFEHLDGPNLRQCLRETDLEGEWPDNWPRAVLPFSLFNEELLYGPKGKKRGRSREGMLALDPPPRFDLVIVDEAHHLRNPETYAHHAVRFLCEHAEAAVFLTATPVQMGSHDLFSLLNVLRPDLIIDQPSFKQMADPNRHIHSAVAKARGGADGWQGEACSLLESAAATHWGRRFLKDSEEFEDIVSKLSDDTPDRVPLLRRMESLNSFSGLINRTRRRDIGAFTTRDPKTVTVAFTEDQRALHDDLLNVIAGILAHSHGDKNVRFMMSMIRRQAASCLYGLAPFLRKILQGKLESLVDTMDDFGNPDFDSGFLFRIRGQIEELVARAETLSAPDPKVDEFLRVLRDKGTMERNKALVFSTFRHTLAYLEKHLREAGLRFGVVHGGAKDDERDDLRRRFALPRTDPDALEVLLSSEVGGEGLDFQFCDLLVNYDLPWNPMRIEQRIGRLDRYGQTSRKVAIVNFVTPGTVDFDIHERCLQRIGIFRHAVGGSEEILGEITTEIRNIADSFELTSSQRAERLQQLADNKIHEIEEVTQLEERQADLFGLTVAGRSGSDEVGEAESRWLSPHALEHCVVMYLTDAAGAPGAFLLGDGPLKTMRLSQQLRNRLLEDFRREGHAPDRVGRDWEKWLKGTDPNRKVTFDQGVAANEPKVDYLHVSHPLVRLAARRFDRADGARVSLTTASESLPPGDRHFAVYRWRRVGVRSDDALVAITADPQLRGALWELLETASDPPTGGAPPTDADIAALEAQHHREWKEARERYVEDNRKQVQHRRQSLEVSHRARQSLLDERKQNATNDRIRRMREGELNRANLDYDRRIADLDQQENRADIHATLIAAGTLHVTPQENP